MAMLWLTHEIYLETWLDELFKNICTLISTYGRNLQETVIEFYTIFLCIFA